MQRNELGDRVIFAIAGSVAERDQWRCPDVCLAVLRLVTHRPDRQIDGAIYFAETGAAFAASRAIDNGEEAQSSGRCATLPITVAKRDLYPLIVALALDVAPFLPQATGEDSRNRQAEWLCRGLRQLRCARRIRLLQ